MLPKMMLEKMKERNLSLREAATEIGVSHTTIARILDGKATDIDTLDAVARWMRVPLTTLLDVRTSEGDLTERIRIAMSLYPELATAFGEIIDGILSGEVEPRVLSDVVAYAAFRLKMGKG